MLAIGLVSAAENPITVSTFEPSQSPISEGETTTLSVTVQNTDDNSSLTSSKAKVCLPSGLSFTTTNETCVTKTLTQDGQAEGTIAAGGQASKTWQISGDVADSYEITVNVEGYLGSDKYTKDKDTSLTVTSSTPLTLSLITNYESRYPGESLTLSAQISNTGGSDATGVKTKLTSTCVTDVSPALGTWRNVTSTGESAGTVASGKSVSLSWSMKAGSTTGSCNLNVDVISDESGNPSDIKTITISTTGDGDGGPSGPGGGPVWGGPPAAKNATRRPELVPGVGLRNNTKLQAAIEKVLAKGKLSENAIENLIRLSNSITAQVEVTRNFKAEGGESELSVRVRYRGQRRLQNFIVHDNIPKTFASSSDNVTVTASGATIEIVEKDPEYIFLYTGMDPDQEIVITYSIGREVSTSVIDEAETFIYAEGYEGLPSGEVCTAGGKRCEGNELQECNQDRTGWVTIETCEYGCDPTKLTCKGAPEKPLDIMTVLLENLIWIAVIIIVIIVVIVGVIFTKKRKKKGIIPKSMPQMKPSPSEFRVP